MFKSLLAVSVLVLSGLSNAADVDNDVYSITFTDKQNKILGSSTLEVGKSPSSGGGIMKSEDKRTDCFINTYNDDPDEAEYSIYSSMSQDTYVKVFTLSQDGNKFKVALTVEYAEDFSTDKAVKIDKHCSFANSVTSVTEINWAGEVEVGKTITVKLPNDNEMYIKTQLGYPDNSF